MEQGDGADVAARVAELRPHAVFLDFDRTLASTKSARCAARAGRTSRDRSVVGSSGRDSHRNGNATS